MAKGRINSGAGIPEMEPSKSVSEEFPFRQAPVKPVTEEVASTHPLNPAVGVPKISSNAFDNCPPSGTVNVTGFCTPSPLKVVPSGEKAVNVTDASSGVGFVT